MRTHAGGLGLRRWWRPEWRGRPLLRGSLLPGTILLSALLLGSPWLGPVLDGGGQAAAQARATPSGTVSDVAGLEAQVRAVSHRLRCPTCQGISVRDSDAAFSLQIRRQVRQLLQEGQTPQQIEAYFVSRYGPWILRTPPLDAWGLLLWGLPVVAFAAALWGLGWVQWRRVRGRRGRSSTEEASSVNLPAGEALEEALQRFEGALPRSKR